MANIRDEAISDDRLPEEPQREPLTLWRFQRELTCRLVFDRGSCVLEVSADRRFHFQQRFTTDRAAIAQADRLRRQLHGTRWLEVDGSRAGI